MSDGCAIRIKTATFIDMVRARGRLEARLGKVVTWDEVVRDLLDQTWKVVRVP